MNIALKTLAAASIASFVFAATPVLADQIKYTAALTAADETPPTDSKGTGTVDATYDSGTKTLTWTIEYKDLTGPVTAAHFHGPAKPGEKADKTRVVLSGFGTEDTHHILHTFRWGPDGCLYFNQSIYIHSHIETPYGVSRGSPNRGVIHRPRRTGPDLGRTAHIANSVRTAA